MRRRRHAAEDGVVQIRPDTPISDPRNDRLGFAVFAEALAEIIDSERTSTPLTVALSAPWGAGKTSVARMTETLLTRRVAAREGERPRVACWFNAWEHNDAPHLGAALAAKVAHTAGCHRPTWKRLLSPLPAAMLGPRERWHRVCLLALLAAAGAAALVLLDPTRRLAEHTLHLDEAFVGGLGWLGALWLALLVWPVLFSAGKDAARFLDDPRSQAAKGLMSQVGDQLGELIRDGRRGGRIVIFVDDLERCPARRAVEVFEVASQLLAHEGVVTVLMADMHALSDAARAAYKGESGQEDADLGRRYLEKLVQLELELPPPTPDSMRGLLEAEQAPRRTEERLRAFLQRARELDFDASELQSWASVGTAMSVLFAFAFIVASGSLITADIVGLTNVIGISSLVGAGAGGVAWLLATFLRQRRQRQRRKLRTDLERKARNRRQLPPDQQASRSSLLRSFFAQEASSYAVDYSDEVARVEAFIRHHPPRIPRSANRMLNHARLLTKIARDRKMFGGTPPLTPEHLGKWIVLRERWPHLAQALTAPDRPIAVDADILELQPEDLATEDELRDLILQAPEIADLIRRLTYFEPAPAAVPPATI